MWLEWSALNSFSVKSDAESLWDNFEQRPKRENTLRTLETIAKFYKPKEYANWRLKYEVSAICDHESNEAIKMLLSNFNAKSPGRITFTDSVFGQLFKALYGDKFVFCCDIIYHFNEVYWEADNKKHTNIQHFINTTFITDLKRWIRGKITYYASKNSEDTETEENSNDDKYMVFWSRLNLCVTEYLQNQKATEQVIKMICSKICNDSQKWDLNPYMFVFKNCVFDLKEGKPTTPNPADFMTTCCGWDYDFNYKCDDKLVKLVSSIQPVQDVRDYLLQAYSTGMVGIQNRNVFIFTGTGGNGKSVLDELLFAMLGGYSYTLPKAFLTQPFKEGANPEVINLHNKRAVLVSEPDANKNIVCSSLKAMSGDSKISSRRLYGDIETINITATNFIECNTAPDLDEMNDAMTDRLGEGVINFNSKFVKKSVWDSATDEERASWAGIQDLYYKEDEFKTAYRQCFFDMLVPYVMKTIKVPASVIASSSVYLTKSDPMYPFLLEHYDKVDGSVIKVKEFHSKFVQQNGYNWTKQQKEKFGSIRKFEDAVKQNVFMRKFIKNRDDRYDSIKLNSLSICGWKEKEEEQTEE
jgi:phage/plasmid-associated DNA primase